MSREAMALIYCLEIRECISDRSFHGISRRRALQEQAVVSCLQAHPYP
jgi:hypothetical protein